MTKALIIVDPQNDFCEGGALGVRNSADIFPIINNLRQKDSIDHIFITLDWHPNNHISFAINHKKEPFTQKSIKGKKQMLWPVHCLQNTYGSMISNDLNVNQTDTIIHKGDLWSEEVYSGFGSKNNPTNLKKKLLELGVETVIIVGLAMDYCVGLTAIDAKEAGFNTTVIKEATKAVTIETQLKMRKKFEEKGIFYLSFSQIDIN